MQMSREGRILRKAQFRGGPEKVQVGGEVNTIGKTGTPALGGRDKKRNGWVWGINCGVGMGSSLEATLFGGKESRKGLKKE